jgi:multidrug efflux pump subunit AcrA (membrane-fusion protein)
MPKLSAPVKKFYVDRGSRVRAGQLLAELENRDLAGAVAESQAAVDQAEANYQSIARGSAPEDLQKAEIEIRTAKDAMDAQQKLFDSRQTLFREGAIAQKDVNDAEVALTGENQYRLGRASRYASVGFNERAIGARCSPTRCSASSRVGAGPAQLLAHVWVHRRHRYRPPHLRQNATVGVR